MKISNVENLNYKKCNTVCIKSSRDRITVPKMEPDVVSFRGGQVNCFKKLTSKTLNRLYNTHFVFSNRIYDEFMYPTFVFNKITGNPVEVVVVPYRIDEMFEEYHIFDPNRDMKKIGKRLFCYETDTDGKILISSGSMESDFKRYSGIGIRLHQTALERMKMKNIKNIEIYSTAEAYPFHKNCGFEPYREINVYEKKYFDKFVKESALSLGIDEEAAKKLMVYKREFDTILLDANATNGNFIDYMHSNRSRFENGWWLPYCSYMRLSPEAHDEWAMFTAKTPILLGKQVPKLYLPNGEKMF